MTELPDNFERVTIDELHERAAAEMLTLRERMHRELDEALDQMVARQYAELEAVRVLTRTGAM